MALHGGGVTTLHGGGPELLLSLLCTEPRG